MQREPCRVFPAPIPTDGALPVYTRGRTDGLATVEQRTAKTIGGPFDGVDREMIAVSEDNAVRASSPGAFFAVLYGRFSGYQSSA